MTIRVGLIGFGLIGKRYYKHLKEDKSFKIVKILKKSKQKNKIFTINKLDFFKIQYDLIIIAAPTERHYDLIKHSSKKNCHLIVEKPLIKKESELRLLNEKILKNFKKKFIVHNSELNNLKYINLKKKLISKKIKKIKFNYHQKSVFMGKKNYPFFEWLPHPISVMIDLLGNPKSFRIENHLLKIRKNELFQDLKITFKYQKTIVDLNFSNYKINKEKNIIFSLKNKSLSFMRDKKISTIKYMLNIIKNKKVNKNEIKLSINTMQLIFKINKKLNL